VAAGQTGATTVAATMIIAALAGIRVFATGGIGGVHRGAGESFDISADLLELARTPVAVVCAGVKSILDIRLTLEVLETHGVPVVGYGTDRLPAAFAAKLRGKPHVTAYGRTVPQDTIYRAGIIVLLFGVLTILWGTRLAANSILDEMADKTWDWQRLSILSPWTMTWGKLFGATAFAWYGGLVRPAAPLTPKHPVEVAKALNAPVLGLYGGADAGIPLDTVEKMKAALAEGNAASKASQFVVYPDAPHAFHADYRASFRKEPAEDGWKRALAWFKTHGVA
jgi:pimeloyl-ACP methyl ester carboxylesterase